MRRYKQKLFNLSGSVPDYKQHLDSDDTSESVVTGNVLEQPQQDAIATDYETYWLYFSYWADSQPTTMLFLIILNQLIRQDACFQLGDDYECDSSWNRVRTVSDGKIDEEYNLRLYNINPESLTLAITSLSVLCQAVVYTYFGPLADHADNKRTFFLRHTCFGIIILILMVVCVYRWTWPIFAALTIAAATFAGTTNMFRRAFIPLISENHHTVCASIGTIAYDPAVKQLQSKLSTRCIAIRCFGAIVLLVLMALWLSFTEDKSDSETMTNFYLTVICAFFGIWWFVFTIPVFMRIRSRTRKPFPSPSNTCSGRFKLAIKNYAKTLKSFKSNWNLFLYLFLTVIFTDGMTTVESVVVLFAEKEVALTSGEISILFLLVQISAVCGAILLPMVQQALNIRLIRMLQLCLFVCGAVCCWTLVGYLDIGLGFVTKTEMMYIPMIYGFFGSYIYAMNIAIPSYMMPEGKESEIFSLLEVFESGTSFIGPLVTSLCSQLVDIRFAFFMITFLIWIPLIGLYWVDIDQGRAEAARTLSIIAVELTDVERKHLNESKTSD